MGNSIWIIIVATLATVITRLAVMFLPLKIKESVFLDYLSKYLPVASFGLLVVYSLKDVSVLVNPFGIPELICIVLIIGLQLWKDKLLVSVFSGSFLYLILVNLIF